MCRLILMKMVKANWPRSRRRQAWHPHRAGAQRSRGFTLLEVLVALVIIGVALAAAMHGALSLTDTAAQTRLKFLAILTAENQLAQLRLNGGQLPLGSVEVACSQGGATLTCEESIQPTPNPFFRRVQVRVFNVPAASDEAPTQRVELAQIMAILPTTR